jgi:hypothetical protein
MSSAFIRDDADSDADAVRVVGATEAALRAESWIPVKVIVVAEVMKPDGDRMLLEASSADVTPWDMLGLLKHALVMVESELEG